MALNGFSVLLFVPPSPEVLAELKRAIYTAFCPLIIRLELSHNAIENKAHYDLATRGGVVEDVLGLEDRF